MSKFTSFEFLVGSLTTDELVALYKGDPPGYLKAKMEQLGIYLTEPEVIALINSYLPSSTKFVYARSVDVPDAPIGDDPTGENYGDWKDYPYSSDGTRDFLWMSSGEFVLGALVGTWSDPVKISGEEGITPKTVFTAGDDKVNPPAPPTGNNPEDDGPPYKWFLNKESIDGYTNGERVYVWKSVGDFIEEELVGDWSTPIFVEESGNIKTVYIFKRSVSVPDTPTVADPTGAAYGDWKFEPYASESEGDRLWMSSAVTIGDTVSELIQTWSSPISIDGESNSYYYKQIFKASETLPADPPFEELNTAILEANGWFDTPSDAIDDYTGTGKTAVYTSLAFIDTEFGVETIVQNWSTPVQWSGFDGDDGDDGIDGKHSFSVQFSPPTMNFNIDEEGNIKQTLGEIVIKLSVFSGSTEYFFDDTESPGANTYTYSIETEDNFEVATGVHEGRAQFVPSSIPNKSLPGGGFSIKVFDNNSAKEQEARFTFGISEDGVSNYSVNLYPNQHTFIVNKENEVVNEEDGIFEVEVFYGDTKLTFDDALNPGAGTYDVEILEQVGIAMTGSTVDGQRVFTTDVGTVDPSIRSGKVKVKITSNDSSTEFVRTYYFTVTTDADETLQVGINPNTHIYSYYHGISAAKQLLTVLVPRTYSTGAGKMMDLHFDKAGETQVTTELSVPIYRIEALVEWAEVFNETKPFGSVSVRLDAGNYPGSFVLAFTDDRGNFTLTTSTLTFGFSSILGAYRSFVNTAEIIELEGGYATVYARWGNTELTCPDTATGNPTVNNTYRVTNITLEDVSSMAYDTAIVGDQFQIQPTNFPGLRATFTIEITAMLAGELRTRIATLSYGKTIAIKGDQGIKGDKAEYLFRVTESTPDTPVGVSPNNWYSDPAAAKEAGPVSINSRLWVSLAYKASNGSLTTGWTEPILLDGPRGISIEQRYKEASSQPSTPTGNTPAGWSTVPPIEPSNSIWVSVGYFDGDNDLIDSWSAPTVWSDRASLDFSELLSSMETDIGILQGLVQDHENRIVALEIA